jgi:hypothetical protein
MGYIQLTSLLSMSNLVPHSALADAARALASSNSFSNAATSDCNTSTLRLRKAGEFRISVASPAVGASDDDVLVSSTPSSSAAVASPSPSAEQSIVDDRRGSDEIMEHLIDEHTAP